jgi:hypothetical protein
MGGEGKEREINEEIEEERESIREEGGRGAAGGRGASSLLLASGIGIAIAIASHDTLEVSCIHSLRILSSPSPSGELLLEAAPGVS